MTADETPVVSHDPMYESVLVDGSYYSVMNKIRLPNGESLPTLEAYLKDGAVQDNTSLVLEIKKLLQGKERILRKTR